MEEERGNLYETLGISKNCDEKEIRKAFKKLAMKNHPDKTGDSQTLVKF